MRRTIPAAAVAAGIMALSGCTAELPDGYDRFKAAREKYETLDSAKVTMTDLDSGEQVMEFSFFFNQNDEMVLSYSGSWNGETQYGYSDGAEFFYKEEGDEKWTVISSGDENYIYNVYNRKYRYPYAEGRMFFLAAEAVQQAEVTVNADGSAEITYDYDASKLNDASMPGVEEDIESFAALTTRLEINPDGIPVSFTESGTVTTVSGETLTLNMQIDVSAINEVFEIPYPVDAVWQPGEKPDPGSD